ncbi:MAG: ASCH domain-containing protein [Thermoproteota archaeon]|nr:MAG: ASCH domain-containing protein [Candidatus Korarchaeota archaeon]
MKRTRITFKKHLVPLILDGLKTMTIRKWSECGLERGDVVSLVSNGREFAKAKVTRVRKVRVSQLRDEDAEKAGYPDADTLKAALRRYYRRLREEDSLYKVEFKLIDVKRGSERHGR